MRYVAAGLLALAVAWLATGWLDGPLGMIPGGPLVGDEIGCEATHWEAVADVPELELEVRPERPRSLTTWSVALGGELFVPADFLTPWKRWPEQVLADDRVRVRFEGRGGRIHACRAERVEDAEQIERLRAAIAAKYTLDPEGRAARVEVWWFRLVPR